MKKFCFTVDDNIRFLQDLSQKDYSCIFDNEYLAVYKRLHDKFGIKVQLNLFYKTSDWDISQTTDRFVNQWQANADWLKLSFHSQQESSMPYIESDYDEVFSDCYAVNEQILRFAGAHTKASTTTVHYCYLTKGGEKAILDCGYFGLLGLYGSSEKPRKSYTTSVQNFPALQSGKVVLENGFAYKAIDVVLNSFTPTEIKRRLNELENNDFVSVMIHEQYFYKDYFNYQPDFEEKLTLAMKILTEQNRDCVFFEELNEIEIAKNECF